MYTILDLFAGAGGLSLGFEETKLFEVKAIVENNENAAKTYIKNHNSLKRYKDILTVDFKELVDDIGSIDVVIGGPPCQGFSNANRQRRHLINGSNELVKRYVEAIRQIKPKVFVMENVKTIASDKHCFCTTFKDKDYIADTLNIEIKQKHVVLYQGNLVQRVQELYKQHIEDLSPILTITEDQLYIVYNVIKKKDKLQKYLNKSLNKNNLIKIINSMTTKKSLPDWYNNYVNNAKNTLLNIVNTNGQNEEYDISSLQNFWDVQRFYQGIEELKNKNVIFQLAVENDQILILLNTYTVIDYIKKSFEYLGYVTNDKILNAASYGVPQTRERFILIGVSQDFKKLNKEDIVFPEPLITDEKEFVTVNEAIDDLQAYEPTTSSMNVSLDKIENEKIDTYFKKMVMSNKSKKIYNHVCTHSTERAIQRFENIKPGHNFHSLPEEMKKTYENPNRTQNTIYKRLDNGKPSDTVVNVRKSMWIHPTLNRAVSAREAARLQSFPDTYEFCGTKDSVYQQIGNAVPPLLGRAVAETVLDLLDNEEKYVAIKSVFDKMKKL